jgi:PAS domain S-box-containing protein
VLLPGKGDTLTVHASESRLEGVLEAAPDAIVGVDVAGVIVLANAQAERLFGYERSELIGMKIEMLVPEGARGLHPSPPRSAT